MCAKDQRSEESKRATIESRAPFASAQAPIRAMDLQLGISGQEDLGWGGAQTRLG